MIHALISSIRARPLGTTLTLVLTATRAAAGQIPVRDSTRDSAIALPPISVTVTRASELLSQVPLAVTVIDRATLGQAHPDLTMDDVLSGVPGVYLANRYNFSLDERLAIRGFGSRSNFGLRGVKVLVDGVPQTLPDGQGQLTNVEFGDIDRIEVIRGSASSLYGNASGGVIAMETRRPGAAPFSQSVRFEGGAFGLFKLLSQTSARSGPVAGSLTVSRFSLDGFRRHSAAEGFQLQASGTYLLSSSTTAEVHFSHASQPKADNPGALTLAELQNDPTAAAPNNLARFAGKVVQQQQASVTLRHFGNHDTRMELTLFGVRRTLDNPLATNVFVDLYRLAGGARVSWITRAGRGDQAPRLTLGVDVQRMRDDRKNFVASAGKATDSTVLNQLETVTELGPFLHVAWSPGSALALSAGTRYDRVNFQVNDRHLTDGVDNSGSRTMAAWSGSLGASLTRFSTVTPYVTVSTSFETPTTTELANQPGTTGGFNNRLNPQRAVNYEIGVRGRPTRGIEFSAAAFLGRIREALIQFQEIGGRAYFSNAGRLNNDGIELGLELSPANAIVFSAAYTYARYRFAEYRIVNGATVDTLDGNRLAGVPAHFVRLAVRVVPTTNVRIDIEQQMSASLFADDANTIKVNGWGAGVTAVRASGWGRLGRLRLEGFAGVNNLFDRSYVSSVTVNGFGGRVFEPAPGRNAYAGVEIGYP